MAWIDDRVWCHPKLTDLSDKSFRVWVSGITYSAGHVTRGRLSVAQQKMIGSSSRTKSDLVAAGLWTVESDDAVVISGWDEHNGKRDDRREADRERKRLARMSTRQSAGTSAGQSIGQSAGSSAGTSAGASAGTGRGTSAGTARVEGSEGSEGSDINLKPLAAAAPPREQKPRKPREPDPIWDALTAQFGEPATKNERGKFNTAVKQLRDAGAEPAQIAPAVREWAKRYPDASCTPMALVNHWGAIRQKSKTLEERIIEAERVRMARWAEEGDAA